MPNPPGRSVGRTILVAVLIAGTLDILDALIFYGLRGVQPIRILQSIASGLLGRSAFAGGWQSAALGLLIHFAITLFWTVLFVLAATRLAELSRRAVAAGLLYGALIYVVMNFAVLPMTRVTPPRHPSASVLVNGVAALMVCMGLPIALLNRRLSPATRVSS